MCAQLIEGGTTPERRAEMDRIVPDQLIPAPEAEPGYLGALNLANATGGDRVMIVLCQTEQQAHRPLSQYSAAFLKALAQIAAISTGNRRLITVWTGIAWMLAFSVLPIVRPLATEGADR